MKMAKRIIKRMADGGAVSADSSENAQVDSPSAAAPQDKPQGKSWGETFSDIFSPETSGHQDLSKETLEERAYRLANPPKRVIDASANAVAGKLGGVGEVTTAVPSMAAALRVAQMDMRTEAARQAAIAAAQEAAPLAKSVTQDAAAIARPGAEEGIQTGLQKMLPTDRGLVEKAIRTQKPSDAKLAREIVNSYKYGKVIQKP